jgi:hypothetical protein
MLHIYASVSCVFILMLQVFDLNVCICLQRLHMCFQVFSGVLQVFQIYVVSFQLFWTYITSVLSGCCKSRSDGAHVAMHVRSGGGVSGPCAWSSGAGPVWACECRLGRDVLA